VGYGYFEGFTAAYLISYGDTLFRFPQPHSIFHPPKKRKTVPYPFPSKWSISITLFH